jgi:hypothetical protein
MNTWIKFRSARQREHRNEIGRVYHQWGGPLLVHIDCWPGRVLYSPPQGRQRGRCAGRVSCRAIHRGRVTRVTRVDALCACGGVRPPCEGWGEGTGREEGPSASPTRMPRWRAVSQGLHRPSSSSSSLSPPRAPNRRVKPRPPPAAPPPPAARLPPSLGSSSSSVWTAPLRDRTHSTAACKRAGQRAESMKTEGV